GDVEGLRDAHLLSAVFDRLRNEFNKDDGTIFFPVSPDLPMQRSIIAGKTGMTASRGDVLRRPEFQGRHPQKLFPRGTVVLQRSFVHLEEAPVRPVVDPHRDWVSFEKRTIALLRHPERFLCQMLLGNAQLLKPARFRFAQFPLYGWDQPAKIVLRQEII